MTIFLGTNGTDVADAAQGILTGFAGGTVTDLQENGLHDFYGYGGNDTILPNDDEYGYLIYGGDGNDILQPGGTSFGSGNTVYGDAGDDAITGSANYTAIYGGTGNDRITLTDAFSASGIEGGAGADRIEVARGSNPEFATVSYRSSAAGITVNFMTNSFTGGDATGDTIIGFQSVIATAHDDRLTGDGRTNFLTGLDGDDFISGGAGNDIVDGGVGENTLYGGAGNDYLGGGSGGNLIDGGAGNDKLVYGDDAVSAVILNLRTGQHGGAAAGDRIISIEEITGSSFGDSMTGSNRDDDLSGGDGNDTISGGDGSDTLNGDSDSDSLAGGTGNDALYGGDGNDRIAGGGGNDDMSFDDGADVYDGGAGHDVVRAIITFDDITLNLQTGVHIGGDTTGDRFANVEEFRTSYGDDILTGDGGDNWLDGDDGLDSLFGGAGNDRLMAGGDGADLLDGGAGSDYFASAQFSYAEFAVIDLGAGTVRGDEDLAGIRFSSIENIDLGRAFYAHTLIGTAKGNILISGTGADTVNGKDGADQLINTGGGDRMTGGSGRDSFAFLDSSPFAASRITDFRENERIGLLEDGAEAFEALGNRISDSEFRIGARARDANDHLIYNDRSGTLSYDKDGKGGDAAVVFADIGRGHDLDAGSFFLL